MQTNMTTFKNEGDALVYIMTVTDSKTVKKID
jgi:hypothetical protein